MSTKIRCRLILDCWQPRMSQSPGLPLGRFYPGLENRLLVAVTEKRTRAEMDGYAAALEEVLQDA